MSCELAKAEPGSKHAADRRRLLIACSRQQLVELAALQRAREGTLAAEVAEAMDTVGRLRLRLDEGV